MKLVFASRNKGKIKEVREILGGSIDLISLLELDGIPEIEETGTTFAENARLKAETVFKYTGIPALGDDSGLVVEQLDGAPGVYSARYSGENATDEENNRKLLQELKKYPEPHHAKFVCAAVYFDGKKFITAEGEVKGKIIYDQRGENGFGYDPLFVPEGMDVTSAELDPEEKNKISHRGKAFRKLKDLITNKEIR